MLTKFCSRCQTEKSVNDFYKNKYSNDGYYSLCIDCSKKSKELNKENAKKTAKKYAASHKIERKEKRKIYEIENKKSIKKSRQGWCKKNRKHLNEYARNRRQNNLLVKLEHNLRTMLVNDLRHRGFTKNCRSYEILKESFEFCLDYLLSTGFARYADFNPADYLINGKYHIDHIIPLSTAKTEEDIKRLCHISNLQLLTAEDNLAKSDRLDWE